MRLPLVVLSLLVLATGVLFALPPASAVPSPADALGDVPPAADTLTQCDAARDQRVLEVVESEIRGALAGRAAAGEIDARVSAAHQRLRTSGALSCYAATSQAAQTPGGQFGAIAVGPGAAWGVSWDHPSQADADRRALRECPNCRVVVRVIGPTCGAYATNGSASGWALGATREVAETRSHAECSARGSRCRVLAYACNTR